ncbi:MAG: hypothetical protein D6808_01020 [Candidatus Dadabacteria bacterium]|nr:MAG: hypothetical protein D6808_01020 [Candidatus Dadabacteria bacterium]
MLLLIALSTVFIFNSRGYCQGVEPFPLECGCGIDNPQINGPYGGYIRPCLPRCSEEDSCRLYIYKYNHYGRIIGAIKHEYNCATGEETTTGKDPIREIISQ